MEAAQKRHDEEMKRLRRLTLVMNWLLVAVIVVPIVASIAVVYLRAP